MATRRRSNAGLSRRRVPAASHREATLPARGSTASDIVGLLLAVAAIALAVALLVPTSAPVTRAVVSFLSLSFGRGALLFPVALLLFAWTFFADERLMGSRVAVGLALVVVAILSLVSLNGAGDAVTPELAVDAAYAQDAGGYVGGGVAWACLLLVGRGVGNVLVAGVLAAGAVICGFSITEAVTRMRGRAVEARERVRELRRERGSRASRGSGRGVRENTSDETLPGGDEPAETSYLGARKTTVLTRARAERGVSQNDEVSLAPTRVSPAPARRRRAKAPSAQESLPGFLRDAPRGGDDAQNVHGAAQTKGEANNDVVASRRPAGAATRPGEGDEEYDLPALTMLSSNPNSGQSASSRAELDETMARLQETLCEFGLASRVVDYVSGPLVTTFQIEMGEGERVSRITNLEDDIALSLAAESVRIFAPIPGTSRVGIEIPNKARQNVHLGDVLAGAVGGPLEFALGRDAAGAAVTADLAAMPHLLVAGATGSGKSVMINSLIMSLLMRTTPRQVRLILVDPKRVEFSGYAGLPHLYVPVVTEPRQAASALAWAVSEMERRLKVFERAGARNIASYNEMCVSGKLADMDNPPEPMPLMVIIIDELSDLMMVAGKDVEASIVRIAQLARAAGIHLVLATQRPSANVVTGLIKSNIETRVALSVASGTDSRVILDQTGAQRLLGNGDMLFKARGSRVRRVLGCFVSDAEIESIVGFIREQAEPDYHEEILSAVVPGSVGEGAAQPQDDDLDPLLWEAASIVVESQLGSTSGLQRRLKVGYARAGRIMDMLEAKGVVGPALGSKPRDVLLDEEGLAELKELDERYGEV